MGLSRKTDAQAVVDTHAVLTTGVHGVGASIVESASGSQTKVDTHTALNTGIHGVGVSTIESAAGSQAKLDAHKDLATGAHGVGAGTIAKVGDIAVDANLSAAGQDAISKRHTQNTDTNLNAAFKATLTPVFSFAVTGTLTTGTDKAPTLLAHSTLTIVKVKLVVKTAPTGAAIIVDVNKNGTTIFTTQANRPQIAAGATTGDSVTPDVTSLVEGDKLTIDIDQVGSTVAGADLTVEVVCS